MNNFNHQNQTQGRKMFMGVVAAGVVLFAAIGIGNSARADYSMQNYGAQSYGAQSYNSRQVQNVQPYAQNDVQPAAPQQFETYRQAPQMAGPGWQRGVGGFGFFGGILRLIGTVFFIGFFLTLARKLFFRGRGFPGGMMGRGPWNGSQNGPWNQRGPGQGNSGVPNQTDGATQEPAAPTATESKPQNPDAL